MSMMNLQCKNWTFSDIWNITKVFPTTCVVYCLEKGIKLQAIILNDFENYGPHTVFKGLVQDILIYLFICLDSC